MSWASESGLLSTDSGSVVDAWRQFHSDAVATEALIWPGGPMPQGQAKKLVDQIVLRMSPAAIVQVHVQTGPPQVPTTAGSAGVLVVSIRS
jgi:hypothetical protein